MSVAEEWRVIPDYAGYEVSSEGRVRSVERIVDGVRRGRPWRMRRPGQLLRLKAGANGYLRVQLGKGGRTELVHRLVLSAFEGPCPDGHEGAHRDGQNANNRRANLKWATHAENIADRRAHGTAPVGSRSPNARLTEQQASEIRLNTGALTQTALSAAYSISRTRIRQIQRNEAWV